VSAPIALTLVLTLAACSPPPEQPALLTYGTGTPTCLLFCTSSAVFADLAESAQITTSLGDTSATGAQSRAGDAGAVGVGP
jgi:hypothetical protein